MSKYLVDRGVGPGDLVLALLGDDIDYKVVGFALMLIGATLVPLNPNASPGEFEAIARGHRGDASDGRSRGYAGNSSNGRG